MGWLQVIAGLIGLLGTFTSWLKERKMVEQAEATVIVANLKREKDRVQQAIDARNAVQSDPDSLRDDKYNRHK